MINDRYYYDRLSEADKLNYRKLYNGIQKYERRIAVQLGSCSLSPSDLLHAVESDNPQLFFVDFTNIEFMRTCNGITYIPQYWLSENEARQLKEKANIAVSKILHRITGNNDYEKELSLHDLLTEKVRYDYLNKQSPYAQSILGVLLHQSAVCSGIAKTVKLLLNQLNIKCIVAHGTDLKDNAPHAWNIVKIQGHPYHLDVTWDINLSKSGLIRRDYLNLPDQAILIDHKPSVAYPRCNMMQDNYYERTCAVVHDRNALRQFLFDSLRRGDRQLVFQCRELDTKGVERCVQQAVHSFLIEGQTSIEYSINREQSIYGIILRQDKSKW